MIDQVVVGRFRIGWSGKVHPIRLADRLHSRPVARQSDHLWVKVYDRVRQIRRNSAGSSTLTLDVFLHLSHTVSRWIDADEQWQNAVLPSKPLDLVDRLAHFVKLFGADIGTMREAKVYQSPLAQQLLLRERLTVGVGQGERTANRGFTESLRDQFLL